MNERLVQFSTNLRERFGHREIVFYLSEESGLSPNWLLEFFEKSVADGKSFKPDDTVQIGWMTTALKENEVGDLEIWEPQFDSIPIKWVCSVNNTIRHLILQRSVADLLHVEPEFASIRQAGFASHSFLNAKDDDYFQLTRESSHVNDSGWRLDVPLSTGDGWECCSLFELSFHRTGIVPFLALPKGAVVVCKNNHVTIDLNGKTVSSSENSFLRELASTSIWV